MGAPVEAVPLVADSRTVKESHPARLARLDCRHRVVQGNPWGSPI
jgi:hypothetical protein